MRSALTRLWRDERAATAVEYALYVSMIALAMVAAATALGTKLSSSFNNLGNKL